MTTPTDAYAELKAARKRMTEAEQAVRDAEAAVDQALADAGWPRLAIWGSNEPRYTSPATGDLLGMEQAVVSADR